MEPDNTKPAETAQDRSKVQVTIQADPTVNHAPYQNNVPLIRSLIVTNTNRVPGRVGIVAIRGERGSYNDSNATG